MRPDRKLRHSLARQAHHVDMLPTEGNRSRECSADSGLQSNLHEGEGAEDFCTYIPSSPCLPTTCHTYPDGQLINIDNQATRFTGNRVVFSECKQVECRLAQAPKGRATALQDDKQSVEKQAPYKH